MSQSLVDEPYMSVEEYLALEGISPFKHEYVDGIMYAMHCGSERDYYELETQSPFRHEYMDGVMYAMAGGKKTHHVISRNLGGMLYIRLRGRRCTNTMSNMKLRLAPEPGEEAELCYPDEMISCDPTDEGETDGHAWIERPTVIFEIMSASTRRLDEGRKRDEYLAIGTLDAYVRIEQDRPEILVERRAGDLWSLERVRGLHGIVRLPTVGIELPLAELYENVNFPR